MNLINSELIKSLNCILNFILFWIFFGALLGPISILLMMVTTIVTIDACIKRHYDNELIETNVLGYILSISTLILFITSPVTWFIISIII